MTVEDKDVMMNRQAGNNVPPRPRSPRPHRPSAGPPRGIPMNPNSSIHQELHQKITYYRDPDYE